MSDQTDNRKLEQGMIPQFLCIALGGNSYLHSFIDEIYLKNKWAYYEAYQNSDFKGNQLFSMYSTKSEEKIRQVAGILEWCYQTNQFSMLDQLIKKGYKIVYQYMQQNDQIDFDQFMRRVAKRQRNKTVKEIDLIYHNIVLWYLCVRENKPFNTKNVAWKSFMGVLNTSINDTKLRNVVFSEKMYEKYQTEINELYTEYNIPRKPRFDSLGAFIEFMIGQSFKEVNKEILNCDVTEAEQKVFQISPTKYVGALGGWLKTLKIHELDATEQMPLTKCDLDMVFLQLIYAQQYNLINEAEQDLFFIACLYLKCLSTVYENTKQLYLNHSKQDYYLEMKAKEEQILEKEADLLKREREWQHANKIQQEEIAGLTQELREAQAKIRQLEHQIEKVEDYTEEVHALRSFVYWEEHPETTHSDSISLKTVKEYIQSKRLVIFGGAPNWRIKIKQALPTIEFIEADEKNRDISKIQRADAVFINTTVFGHSFYKKITKELSSCDTPLYYLNGQTNTDKTILEMHNCLTG
jgi:hypothetical protein